MAGVAAVATRSDTRLSDLTADVHSGEMLVDAGIPWVVLGHSERRTLCGETNEVVATKVKYALGLGLKVMACIGETLEQREAGTTLQVCEAQLAAIASASPPTFALTTRHAAARRPHGTNAIPGGCLTPAALGGGELGPLFSSLTYSDDQGRAGSSVSITKQRAGSPPRLSKASDRDSLSLSPK
jgi:hypothetical protein